jgi:hypothetical protein
VRFGSLPRSFSPAPGPEPELLRGLLIRALRSTDRTQQVRAAPRSPHLAESEGCCGPGGRRFESGPPPSKAPGMKSISRNCCRFRLAPIYYRPKVAHSNPPLSDCAALRRRRLGGRTGAGQALFVATSSRHRDLAVGCARCRSPASSSAVSRPTTTWCSPTRGWEDNSDPHLAIERSVSC